MYGKSEWTTKTEGKYARSCRGRLQGIAQKTRNTETQKDEPDSTNGAESSWRMKRINDADLRKRRPDNKARWYQLIDQWCPKNGGEAPTMDWTAACRALDRRVALYVKYRKQKQDSPQKSSGPLESQGTSYSTGTSTSIRDSKETANAEWQLFDAVVPGKSRPTRTGGKTEWQIFNEVVPGTSRPARTSGSPRPRQKNKYIPEDDEYDEYIPDEYNNDYDPEAIDRMAEEYAQPLRRRVR